MALFDTTGPSVMPSYLLPTGSTFAVEREGQVHGGRASIKFCVFGHGIGLIHFLCLNPLTGNQVACFKASRGAAISIITTKLCNADVRKVGILISRAVSEACLDLYWPAAEAMCVVLHLAIGGDSVCREAPNVFLGAFVVS